MVQDKRIQGKYKGFPVLMENEAESGGRKLALNRYVYTNKQGIQDVGGIPQTFTVDIVITGDNYIEDAKKFRNLLVSGESGLLILQAFGSFWAYVSRYSRDNSNNNIGEIVFSVTFEVEDTQGADADEVDVSEIEIYQEYLEANEELTNSILSNWTVPNTNLNKLLCAIDNNKIVQAVRGVAETVNDVARAAEKIKNTVDTAINRAETYAEIFAENGPLAALSSAVGMGEAYRIAKDITQFGNDLDNRVQGIENTLKKQENSSDYNINLWPEGTSKQWDNRNTVRVASVETQRLSASLLMLQQAPGAIGNTFEQANKIKLEMNEVVENVVLSPPYDSVIVTPELVEKVLNLRDTAQKYINQKSQELYYVTEDRVTPISSRVVAYNRYGGEEKSETIKSLNEYKPYLDRKIRILKQK